MYIIPTMPTFVPYALPYLLSNVTDTYLETRFKSACLSYELQSVLTNPGRWL